MIRFVKFLSALALANVLCGAELCACEAYCGAMQVSQPVQVAYAVQPTVVLNVASCMPAYAPAAPVYSYVPAAPVYAPTYSYVPAPQTYSSLTVQSGQIQTSYGVNFAQYSVPSPILRAPVYSNYGVQAAALSRYGYGASARSFAPVKQFAAPRQFVPSYSVGSGVSAAAFSQSGGRRGGNVQSAAQINNAGGFVPSLTTAQSQTVEKRGLFGRVRQRTTTNTVQQQN
jgi:hypothetical protein